MVGYLDRSKTLPKAVALRSVPFSNWECVDCWVNTWSTNQMYMVTDELWDKHGAADKMLCLTCLESRVGRRLALQDFKPLPLTFECMYWNPSYFNARI